MSPTWPCSSPISDCRSPISSIVALGPSFCNLAFSASSLAVRSGGTLTGSAPSFPPALPVACPELPAASRVRLLLSKFLLRSPECFGTIDSGLVADDVGLLITLEPDEISWDLFLKALDMMDVLRRSRHGEGVGFARDDNETVLVVVAVRVRIFLSRGVGLGRQCVRRTGATGTTTELGATVATDIKGATVPAGRGLLTETPSAGAPRLGSTQKEVRVSGLRFYLQSEIPAPEGLARP